MSARPEPRDARAVRAAVGSVVSPVTAAAAAGRRRGRLPRVLHDVPAAVLLVDQASGAVVHANPDALELVPGRPLPVAAGQWAQLAALTRPDGAPYAVGDSPVERAAAGHQVLGEPVVVTSGTRPGVRWMTAFPVPAQGAEQVLVVFFEVETDSAAVDAQVHSTAVVAAGLSFTITDPTHPDNPLVFVNPAFERTTGYSAEESHGRNCRFLQGPETDPAAVEEIRAALAAERGCSVTLLNYRKDGTAFWNDLSISPVYDGNGALTHFVGIQSDVTARVVIEQERERHLAAEQAAREEAERAQRRLALLAEATSMLAATLDVDESLERLTDLVVPLMGDWCTVDLLGQGGEVRRVASKHSDPEMAPLLRLIEERQPAGLSDRSATSRVLAGGPPELWTDVPADHLHQAIEDPELRAAFETIGIRSAIVVPLRARRQVLGALGLFTSDSGRTYDADDLDMAADLARRAALTVDNARLYQREHDVAEALQRSLLPELPTIAGLDSAARYLPSASAAQVGGDWYDVLALPDGCIGLAVGDVMGHDLTAAAAMGQLRSVLRSYAWRGLPPALVLDQLDELVQGLQMAQLATALYARLTLPSGTQPGLLSWTNAGHLPPVVRRPDGTVERLTGEVSLLVGAAPGASRSETHEQLAPGSVIVLYTDGLVEHRELDLDDGLAFLEAALGNAPDASAEAIADSLVEQLVAKERDDDVALLVVRLVS